MRPFLRITRNVDIFTKFFNVGAVILVMFSFVRIVTGEIEARIYLQPSDRSKDIVADMVNTEKIITLPNICYIILDSYTGENVLETICNYDNSKFYNYLKKGFTLLMNPDQIIICHRCLWLHR